MGEVRYRAEDAANLIIRPLDELNLIYHRLSGITHIVASPVPEMLAIMKDDALNSAELLERLSHSYALEAEADLKAVVQARLDELTNLGLIKRL